MAERALITGAAGQVGQELVRALGDRGMEVHAADIVARPDDEVFRRVSWHELDIVHEGNVRGVVDRVAPDVVFHLAALLSARGEAMHRRAYAVNQTGTYNLLEACRAAGVGRLVFASTIAVFGPGLAEPVRDDVPLHPTTMYGATKAAGELLGDYYHHRFGLDFRAVRFPGLISASLPGGGTSDYALFMYVDGIRVGHYEAFCRPDTRIPLMYMPDGIRALLELSEVARPRLRRSTYNIAAFSPTAQQIADSVTSAVPGARLSFRPDPMRQEILDSWPATIDDSAARRDWGWQADYELEAMTRDLVPKIRGLLASGSTLLAAPG